MKKLSVLLLSICLMSAHASIFDYKGVKGGLSCAVATGVVMGLSKDKKDAKSISAGLCALALSYDLMSTRDYVSKQEVEDQINEASKKTSDDMVKFFEESKRRYAIYQRVIRKVVIKKFEELKGSIDKKLGRIKTKKFKSSLRKNIMKEVNWKIKQELGVVNRDTLEVIKKELNEVIPNVVNQVVDKLNKLQESKKSEPSFQNNLPDKAYY
ncbi:MAG: hypothetical protein GY909_15175 [Oligoflexia bacterium]|nr:hypothetical protein [Oligoflexia bacterium]